MKVLISVVKFLYSLALKNLLKVALITIWVLTLFAYVENEIHCRKKDKEILEIRNNYDSLVNTQNELYKSLYDHTKRELDSLKHVINKINKRK